MSEHKDQSTPGPRSPVPDPEPIVAFIGGGNMARSLIAAQLARGVAADRVRVAEPQAETRESLAQAFGVATFAANEDAAAGADCVLLAVKPQVMRTVCEGLTDTIASGRPLLVSIAAGIRVAQLERLLGAGNAIVRCVPNTPAMVGAGATALLANRKVDAAQRALAEHIFGAAGIVRWVDDDAAIDTVTALSGSGPAYFFLLAESMENAAVEMGLSRDTARALAAQTCLGAGRMLTESGETAATLRERVTSPHGTTAAALDVFEDDGLRALAARALDAAAQRAAELSSELDSAA